MENKIDIKNEQKMHYEMPKTSSQPKDNAHLVNEVLVKVLGNLEDKSEDTEKPSNFLSDSLIALVSESSGKNISHKDIKKEIGKMLEQSNDEKIKNAYSKYCQEPHKPTLNHLKEKGDFAFFSISEGVNGIITYEGENKYSLTIINPGEGIKIYHPENEKHQPYTRYTLEHISGNKLENFISSDRKTLHEVYQDINLLDGLFNKEESHRDNEKTTENSSRSELLMLKQVMKAEDYLSLKIQLSEKAVLGFTDSYKSKNLSTNEKIIFLDCIQKLKKRYDKNGQIDMVELMNHAEIRIKEDLSKLMSLSSDHKNTHPLLPSFFHTTFSILMGNFKDAEEKINALHFELNKAIKNDGKGNQEAFERLVTGFNLCAKSISGLKPVSVEQLNLFTRLFCNFYKLAQQAENFGLPKVEISSIINSPMALALNSKFEKHDFIIDSFWKEEWKEINRQIELEKSKKLIIFDNLPNIPKDTHPLLESFIKSLQAINTGELKRANEELHLLYKELNNVGKSSHTGNQKAFEIIRNALNILSNYFYITEDLISFFSDEHKNLFAGLFCIYTKLAEQAGNFNLPKVDVFSVLSSEMAFEINKKLESYNFLKNSPWEKDWKNQNPSKNLLAKTLGYLESESTINRIFLLTLKGNNLKASIALTSESTSLGSFSENTKRKINKALKESNLEKVKTAYELHTKNNLFKAFDNLKKTGDFMFVSLAVPQHHITGIITYEGENRYSLTIVNSGAGVVRHPKNDLGKYYTRYTLKDISKDKIQSFISKAEKGYSSTTYKKEIKRLYGDIEQLEGKFSKKGSFVDNLQLGGSCAGRQELLMLKHLMKSKDYRLLKIKLSEEAVFIFAHLYKYTKLSKEEKIVFLDCVQRLKKRYRKNKQMDMIEPLEQIEVKIKKELSGDSLNRKIFGSIPNDSPKNAHPLLRSFIKSLKAMEDGDLKSAKEEITALHLVLEKAIKNKNAGNQAAFEIIKQAFDNFKMAEKDFFSMEQHNLLTGLLCNYHKLIKNHKNFGLGSVGISSVINNDLALLLEHRLQDHNFLKDSDWKKDWEILVKKMGNPIIGLIDWLGLDF